MRRMASQELNELRERVEAWRKQQGKRKLIPEELWGAAVRVSKIDGVWATAHATRLRYGTLAERASAARRRERGERKGLALVERLRGRRKEPASVEAAFVELPMSGMGPGGTGRTVIDLVARDGGRMRVDVGGGVDLVGLVQTFWSRQPCCS